MKKLINCQIFMSLIFVSATFLNVKTVQAINLEMAFPSAISIGQKQTVPLNIKNIPERGLAGFTINLYLDPSKVTIANETDIQFPFTKDPSFSLKTVGSYLCLARINNQQIAGIQKVTLACATPFKGVAGDIVAANIAFTGTSPNKETTNIIIEILQLYKSLDWSIAEEPEQPAQYLPLPSNLNVTLISVPILNTPKNISILSIKL